MRILDNLKSWFAGVGSRRSIAGSETWITNPTLAGITVTEESAVTFGAVFAAINVLASDVSAYPFAVVKRDDEGNRVIDYNNRIHDIVANEPNEELDTLGLYGSIMWHECTKGNAYLEIERERETLAPVAIHLLEPDLVQVKRASDRSLYYLVEGKKFLARDIIHIAAVGRDGLIGRSPITQCREEIGLGMATVKFGAAHFGNGISSTGVVEIPGTLDELETKNFRKGINREHQGVYNANKFLLLQGGAKFVANSISAEDAQFLESRKFNVEEICRIFRVPPTKLMNFDRATFANIEETNLDYYLSSLLPWLRRIESQLNRKLFTRAERKIWKIEHDESFSLRGRIADQANVEKIYRDMGVLNTDEIRARHGWGKVAGGKARFVPLNMAPLEQVASATLDQLKGLAKPTAAEPAKPDSKPATVDAGDEVDVPILTADDDVVRSVRDVLLDTTKRMVKREANALRSIAKKKDMIDMVTSLDKHYSNEVEVLTEALLPSIRAYCTVSRKFIDTRTLADAIVKNSMAEVEACIKAPNTAAGLVALADQWEDVMPDEILHHIEAS